MRSARRIGLRSSADSRARSTVSSWSPDGSALLVNFAETESDGYQLAVVKGDGSGSRSSTSARPPTTASGGRTAEQSSSAALGRPPARSSPTPTARTCASCRSAVGLVDFEGLAGRPTAASELQSAGARWHTSRQINIADIDEDGAMTGLRRLKLEPSRSTRRRSGRRTAASSRSWS